MLLPRRRLLISALVGAATCAVPRLPRAGTLVSLPSDSANRRFSIFYKDHKIGAHTVSNTANGETCVTTEINMLDQGTVLHRVLVQPPLRGRRHHL
jgi:hypothetical protein